MRNLLLFAALWTAPAMAADPAAEGKQVFVRVGCYQCHGYAGQGGSAGLKLAPDPLPYDALSTFVRGTTGAMPAYSTAILPDADLQKIYAYLKSIKKAPSVDSLPLLKNLQ
jgi:ubiquinol-cytochrome c reductase cytochrome c subunit